MLIISISGGSGSGKTTLAKDITHRFPADYVTLLPMDAYYNDHSFLSNEEKMRHNFDHPDAMDFKLLASHIQKLRAGGTVERPVYSFITCSRQPFTTTVRPSAIILIDGFMALLDKKLRDNIDFKIFIDVDESNRLQRIIERDEKERGRSKQLIVERFYKTVQPMHDAFIEPSKRFADIIIDGNPTDIQAIADSIEFAICRKLHMNYKNACKNILHA